MLLPEFGEDLNIVPGIPATHLPSSLFDYMTATFFKQICSKAMNSGEIYETSVFMHLDSCGCDGANFYGMPDV